VNTGFPAANSSDAVQKNGRRRSHEKPSRRLRPRRCAARCSAEEDWKSERVSDIALIEQTNEIASARNGSALAAANSTPPNGGPAMLPLK